MFQQLFLFNKDIQEDHQEYYRYIITRVMIYLSCIAMPTIGYLNYSIGKFTLLYMNIIIFIAFLAIAYITRKSLNISFASHAVSIILFLSIVLGIATNKGGDYMLLWTFLYPFFSMMLLGHKKGLLSSILLYVILFSFAYSYIGEALTYPEFVRYIIVSILMLLLATFYEFFKNKSLEKLYEERDKAKKATKSKSEFLANMSHEIRTPMNGIIGMSTLTLQTSLNTQQKKYVQNIDSSAKLLLKIINDILDFSKIEAGKLKMEAIDFNLHALILDIKNSMEYMARERNIDLKLHCPDVFCIHYGDPFRVGQIITNLIGNALKFTQDGKVTISVSKLENEVVQFSIKDTGIGISKEQQTTLFESFTQADGSTTRKYGGTGLGLAISQQLVEMMGGKIYVQSELGKGSEFIFEIPLPTGDESNLHVEKTNDKNLYVVPAFERNTILLVEDNTINQEIILGFLEKTNLSIEIAHNGLEATQMVQENNYKLILMDIQMPIMDGYEATHIIRELGIQTPIIALTANAMLEDIQKTKQAGMDEHLNKPLEFQKLYEILGKYIKILDTQILNQDSSLSFSSLKVLDTQTALKTLGQNKKLYLKILKDFYMKYKKWSLEDKTQEEVQREIHTLKGLSANIGAMVLHVELVRIEKSQDKTKIQNIYDILKEIIDELESTINLNPESVEKKEISAEDIENLFKDLTLTIKMKQPLKYTPILQKLEECKLSADENDLLQSIKLLLSKYKFKDAINLMEQR